MKYLFMDNFRGFTKTVLPIKDINFFVGENSTGKTSVLGLVNLFASSGFWFYQNFDAGGTEFGNFDDIVSVNAENKSYFSVGLIEANPPQEKDGLTCTGFLMTFKKSEGMPLIWRYSYIDDNQDITVKYSGDNARFTHQELLTISDAKSVFSRYS